MGPAGTVITFPDEMGLPSVLNSKPSRYDIKIEYLKFVVTSLL